MQNQPQKIIITQYKSPIGVLILGSIHNKLCICDWQYRKNREKLNKKIQLQLNATFTNGTSQILEQTKKQLDEYFAQKRETFEVPFVLLGTQFQKKVWNKLARIKYGKTKTYKQIAQEIDNPLAVRAVANANGANNLAIIIPCHRIIGSQSQLTGYSGGLNAKKALLDLETQ